MKINNELKKYIEENIFPEYDKNENGHSIDHIKYVIDRSFKLVDENKLDVNLDMVYTIASFHDIGHSINPKIHEIISADMMIKDENLKKFFTDEERHIIKEAIEDHRASSKEDPRSIYGKIVSSADRETRIDVQLSRMYQYRLKHHYDKSLEWMIEDIKNYIINKFGQNGYATDKIYFEDKDYKEFLKGLSSLVKNDKEFTEYFKKVNGINEYKRRFNK